MHATSATGTLLLAAWLASAAAAEMTPIRAAPSAAPPAVTPDTTPPARRAASEGWWNRPHFIALLGLDDRQRRRMDEILRRHRERAPGLLKQMEQTTARLRQALLVGQWKQARALNAQLGQDQARVAGAEEDLRIEILSQLTKEQLDKLRESSPGMITNPWPVGKIAGPRGKANLRSRR